MNKTFILYKILETYEEFGIKCFPFNCSDLIVGKGYRVFSYRELKNHSPELYELCVSFSDEAYTEPITHTVAYNQANPYSRISFSLAHELGHIILGHPYKDEGFEKEANYFASNILAPRIAIHYAHCQNAADVSHVFGLSLEAAEYAYEDYKRWLRLATYKMSSLDWSMYKHFWNEGCEKFVYSITYCYDCDELIYNQPGVHQCYRCSRRKLRYYKNLFEDELLPDSLSWHGIVD